MKAIILAAILVLLVVGIGVFFQNMLGKDSREMMLALQDAAKQVQKEKWLEAEATLQEISRQWQGKRKKWHAVSDHTEIRIIDESMARLKAYISVQEKKDCLAEIAALQQTIRYIPDKEKLTLSNIF
jgi:uncharacterized protein YxeA